MTIFNNILKHFSNFLNLFTLFIFVIHLCVCEVGTVGKISDCQPEGPGFNPRPGRGLSFGRPSFATPSVERDVKPLVQSLDVLLGDLKEPTHLSIRVG